MATIVENFEVKKILTDVIGISDSLFTVHMYSLNIQSKSILSEGYVDLESIQSSRATKRGGKYLRFKIDALLPNLELFKLDRYSEQGAFQFIGNDRIEATLGAYSYAIRSEKIYPLNFEVEKEEFD